MVSAQTKPPPHPADVAQLPLRRFTVDEYFAMAEAGILKRGERVELIDGVIVAMAPMGNPHRATVNRLSRMMFGAIGTRAIVQVQCPITLDDRTMPEPDLALLRERADFYESEDTYPDDVLLVIEVADASVDYDRHEKLPRYARAGIPEVWIAVLPERIIAAHTKPVDGRYTVRQTFASGDAISPGCFPDISLPVSEILPG